jgi:oligoribonuclease (3'-5' exoribonuclease)
MKVFSERLDRFGIPLFEGEEEPKKKKISFLPEHLVMVDCEFSGVLPERDDLLQIAMLKLRLVNNQYEVFDEPLEIFLHSNKKPSCEFHRKFLKDVFRKANESYLEPEDAKQLIHDWLGKLKGVVTPAGDCVPLDLAFLYAKGCIDRGDIVDDKPVPGTFHYEVFDANSIKAIARQKMGKKEEIKMEPGEHNAVVDCVNQTKELNYFLEVLL